MHRQDANIDEIFKILKLKYVIIFIKKISKFSYIVMLKYFILLCYSDIIYTGSSINHDHK